MQQSMYDTRVLVNGKRIDEYSHEGRTYIEGRQGSEYAIDIKNPTPKRVLAVISVDGINVLTGEPAEDDNRAGYVIDAYGSYKVKGFRQDLNTVGAFKFCQKSSSYCNDAGLPNNNGIIGVRIFEEQQQVHWTTTLSTEPPSYIQPPGFIQPASVYHMSNSVADAGPVNSADSVSFSCNTNSVQSNTRSLDKSIPDVNTEFNIGTTWGKKTTDKVEDVDFTPGSILAEMEIYYASKNALKKMGIKMVKKPQVVFPKAFGKFAKPPVNWKG